MPQQWKTEEASTFEATFRLAQRTPPFIAATRGNWKKRRGIRELKHWWVVLTERLKSNGSCLTLSGKIMTVPECFPPQPLPQGTMSDLRSLPVVFSL